MDLAAFPVLDARGQLQYSGGRALARQESTRKRLDQRRHVRSQPSANGEIIRGGLGVLLLAAFIGVIYSAARRFIGPPGKTSSRATVIFTGAPAFLLIPLLSLRSTIEALISNTAAQLNKLTHSPEATWPTQAAVGLFRTVITFLALVLIIQAIGRFYWYVEGRPIRAHATRKGAALAFWSF